ncbi:MAG: hypothetical protein RDV48_12410 [Candidatus Eremiobacteraeota bacterium]|nr:hypothetical protein [Candidatus Eremiobacteraeota bacterium]
MLLPVYPVWVIAAISALLVVNYLLLYHKLYFMIDCAMVTFLGFFSLFGDRADLGSYYLAKPLLDAFYLLLIFASMRLLNRREFLRFFSGGLMLRSRVVLAASLLFTMSLWYAVYALPEPMVIPGLSTLRSNLKNIGTSLEMYSTDHKGYYPEKLEDVTPEYLRQLPPAGYSYDKETKKYYFDRYGTDLSYGYEVDNRTFNYTVSVSVPGTYGTKGQYGVRYSSIDGLTEDGP